MKNYYVYKLVDKITNEFYIGSRGTSKDIELDSYMGSPYVWIPNKENLVKTIVKSGFKSKEEAILYERKLIVDCICNELNRNYSIPHPNITRDNLVTAKDVTTGKILTIFKDDPLFGSQYVGVTKGKVVVRDKDGNMFSCDVNNENYINGEYIHVAVGMLLGAEHHNWEKVWVNNGTKQELIPSKYIADFIKNGFMVGTLQKGKTTNSAHVSSVWVNDGNSNRRINSNELTYYENLGFSRGRVGLRKYKKRNNE